MTQSSEVVLVLALAIVACVHGNHNLCPTSTQTVASYPVNEIGQGGSCGGQLNGGAVYFQPPYNLTAQGFPQYGFLDFAANVSCSVGTSGNLGNGCPTKQYVERYDYTKVDNSRPSLPFIYKEKEMSFSTQAGRTNTLVFPNTGVNGARDNAGMTSPGVYTFNFWAQSVCGKSKSKDVQLIARCPPIPSACAVVRKANPRTLVSMNGGSFSVLQGQPLVLDGISSHAFQFVLPNKTYSNFNITSAEWSISGGVPGKQFSYLKQTQSQNSNPQVCSSNNDPTCSCALGDSFRCLQRFVRFNAAGSYSASLTVSDGCSFGKTTINIVVTCSCVPSAMVKPVASLNTQTSNGNLNNHIAPAASQNSGTVSYNLMAKGNDYDGGSMYYDWMWVNWSPDYSQMVGNTTYRSQSGLNPPSSQGGISFSGCTAADGQPMASPCFSNSAVITSLANANRIVSIDINNQANYVYRVLYTVTPPGTENITNWKITNPVQSRVQTWRFMKLAPQLPPATSSMMMTWNKNGSLYGTVTNVTTVPAYTRGNGATTLGNPDFNGFNTGGQNTVNQDNNQNFFLPNTQFKAYVSVKSSFFNNERRFFKTTDTPQPKLVRDLVYCKVIIWQTSQSGSVGGNAFGTTDAKLSMSSFGTCRGLWTFKLMVSDGCSSSTDSFNLNVGCNRKPSVSAGCSNTQTWAGSSFSQINLDGRASFDPDNFGDSFYNLKMPTTMAGSALTYAWVLKSGPGYNMNSPKTTCPFNPFVRCAQPYCSDSVVQSIQYNNVSFVTGKAKTQTYDKQTGYRPSIQGNAFLSEAYNSFPLAYSYNTSSPNFRTSGANFNVSLGSVEPPTLPEQLIPLFPDFKSQCAPTVFPMYTISGGNNAQNTKYALLNKQHQGQSAFMQNVTNEGPISVRLYAFDGCSVSFSDVTVHNKCPSLQILSPSNNMGFKSQNSPYVMYFDTTASSVNSGNAVQFKVPQDVGVNYQGAPDVSVTVSLTITGPNGFKQVLTAQPTPGPGSSRVSLTSALTVTIPGVKSNVGNYQVSISATDGCGRKKSGGFDPTISVSNVATFSVTCPYQSVISQFNLEDFVMSTFNVSSPSYQSAIGSDNTQVQNGVGIGFQQQRVSLNGFVVNNTGVTGNHEQITDNTFGSLSFSVQVYYASAAPTNINQASSASYAPLPVASFTPSTNGPNVSAVTVTLSPAWRRLGFAKTNPTVAVGTGNTGFGTFSSQAINSNSQPLVIQQQGFYKVQVTASPRSRTCYETPVQTKYFGVNCYAQTPLKVRGATPAGTSGPVLTLSPFVPEYLGTSPNTQWGDGQYNQGNSAANRYNTETRNIQGAFKKIGLSASRWWDFQCGYNGCSGSGNFQGGNVVYQINYVSTTANVNGNNVNQNPLSFSPYSAFNLAADQLINPTGFASDPNVLVPTFPGQWQVQAFGQNPCFLGNYTQSSFTGSNNPATFTVNAYCSNYVMPNATLDIRYDFSTRTNSSSVLQPEFNVCPGVNSVSAPNNGRRLMGVKGQSSVPVPCGSCSNTEKTQMTVTMYWDSFDVFPEYKSGTKDVRNFNDMGQIVGLNGNKFPYGMLTNGQQRNFVGRFPTLVLTVPPSSFYSNRNGNSTHANTRYISWFNWNSGIPSASGSCQAGSQQGWKVTGCSPAFMSGTSYGDVFGTKGFSSSLTSINVLQVTGVKSAQTVTSKYQVFVWNGPPGLSCYDYRTVQVCSKCNSLSVSQLSLSQSTVTWDGTKFPSVGMSATVTYNQFTTTSGGESTMAGNLYSLSYGWKITNSPMASQLNIPYGEMYTTQIPASFSNGQPVMVRTTPTVQVNSTEYTSNGVPFLKTVTNYNETRFYQQVQTDVSLTNHHYLNPVTCMQPDVEGAYGASLIVKDGCTQASSTGSVTAKCISMPSSVSFQVSTASGATTQVQSNGASAAITVDGTKFDRISVRASVTPGTGSNGNQQVTDEYTYYWQVKAMSSDANITVMNGQGTLVSFFAKSLPQWLQSSNAQNYRVSLVAASNCPNAMGMRTQKTYTFMLSVTCNPAISGSQDIVFPKVTVNSTESYTMREFWWGGNLNHSMVFGNATVDPTSVSCSISDGGPMGGPSRFCGPSATSPSGQGVPTVLFTSTEYGFRNAFFRVDGSYNTRCNVGSTFWQLTSMACALPYVPSYTVRPPPPMTCKPQVTAWWSIEKTPCGSCGNNPMTSAPVCEFAQFQNYERYQVPSTQDNSGNPWQCIYSGSGRLASSPNAAMGVKWCTDAGVGLQGQDGTNAQFTPRFPGTYVLNYTITDNCNKPKVFRLTVVARCVTKVVKPNVPNAVTNFYCNGDSSFNSQSKAAGEFQSIDLSKLANEYPNTITASSFNSPTPADLTYRCVVPTSKVNCVGLQNVFNTYNFGDNIDSSVQNKFKHCCQCLYSLQIINGGGGGSGGSPTTAPPSTTTSSSTTASGSSTTTGSGSTTSPGSTSSPNGGGSASSQSALTAEEQKRKRNENVLIGLAAPLGVILVASMALNAYMILKLRAGAPGAGFNVEAGDVELSTSPNRHMDV